MNVGPRDNRDLLPNRGLLMGATWKLECEQENEVRQPELETPLTKRQLKRRRNKDSNLAKKFKNLEKENDNLKSQMEELEDNKNIPKHQC